MDWKKGLQREVTFMEVIIERNKTIINFGSQLETMNTQIIELKEEIKSLTAEEVKQDGEQD